MSIPIWQTLAQVYHIHTLQAQVVEPTEVSLAPESLEQTPFGSDSDQRQLSTRPLTTHISADLESDRYIKPPLHSSGADVMVSPGFAPVKNAPQVTLSVYEASGALLIVTRLPGVDIDDVTIELRRDSLQLHVGGDTQKLSDPITFSAYERTIVLPRGFGSDIGASLVNGKLTIRIARGEFGQQVSIHPIESREVTPTSTNWSNIETTQMSQPAG